MANYSAIKAAVNAYIKQNGRKEITGRILNAVLNATIDSLGRFFQFAGGAMPTDDPGTPDQNVCYLAGEPGVYTNFGGITIENEEVALLFWNGEWTKQRILIGIREVNASVDNQVGTPSVDVNYSQGQLVLTFHNLKGNKGDTGNPAGFGTIGADINGGVGTPGVSVETSGDNTAKNLMFHFTNLKGETGVTSVVSTIDNTSGTPSCQVSLVNGVLTLAFSGLKGLKGDTGVSADYPITIYNGLDSDATDQALSAAQGKILDGKVSQLEAKVDVVVDGASVISPNIFNKDDVVNNKAVDYRDGTSFTATGYCYSGRIPIPADAASIYMDKASNYGARGWACYNANAQYTHGANNTRLVTVQPGDAFLRFSLSMSDKDTCMAVVGTSADIPSEYVPYGTITTYRLKDNVADTVNIIDNAVTTPKLADGSVTGSKLADGSVTGDKLDEDAILDGISDPVQKYVGYNLLNPATSQNGYINKDTGAFVASSANEHLFGTDFIPVVADVYAYPYTSYGATGGGAVYDSNKAYLRSTGKGYTYQSGDAFVRFTYKDNNGYQIICNYPAPTLSGTFDASYVEQDITPFSGDQVFDADNIPVAKPAIASVGQDGMKKTVSSLSGTYTEVTDWPSYLKSGQAISVKAKIATAGEIRVGFNRGDNNGYFVKVDSTKVYLCKYTSGGTQELTSQNHGLTIGTFVDVFFRMSLTSYKVVIMSVDGNNSMSGDFEGIRENYGVPFVEAVGSTALTDIVIRVVSDTLRKPVWVIGDSYVSLYQQRWTYQLLSLGFGGFLIDGLAGGGSIGMFSELEKLLSLGCPKFLVWCLGMNDASWNWRQTEKKVEMLCRARGVELILTTIPWPTGGSKADINQCVKESGYRYIDVYDAVSSDENGTWYSGMNDDGTHPTVLGAKAIAGQVLADFPEITY